MTYAETENELLLALQDRDISVLALVGRWGTGKTHLWRNAAGRLKGSHDPTADFRHPILISLFGVRKLSELKLQIIQNSLLDAERMPAGQGKRSEQGGDVLPNASVRIAVGASDADIAAFSLPSLVFDRLIVIDDVERKHHDLSIEELLGFIDTAKERWGTRFLLLLNTDRLDDKEAVWHTLYEKVIDRQIALAPTPREAFEVAFLEKSDRSSDLIAAAVEALGITNIRVIRRIAKVASRFLEAAPHAGSSFIGRIIPSVVLMSAIHYRALKSAPSLEYVARFNQLASYMTREQKSVQELEWDDLIRLAGVRYPGEFERILQRYLETGHLDRTSLDGFVQGLEKENNVSVIQDDGHRFLLMARWDISRKPADVVEQASRFVPVADQIPAYLVGEIAQAAGENGGLEVERALIDACLGHFDALVRRGEANAGFFQALEGQLHPRLRDRANKFAQETAPGLTLFQAIEKVIGNEGWGDAERKVLTRASPEQFIEAMNAASPDDLMKLITGLLRWMRGHVVTPETNAAHTTFLLAARQIVASAPYSLLARLLIREFTLHRQHHRLRPSDAMPT